MTAFLFTSCNSSTDKAEKPKSTEQAKPTPTNIDEVNKNHLEAEYTFYIIDDKATAL